MWTLTYLKIFKETVEKDIPDLETQIHAFKTGEWLKGRYQTNVEAYKESVRGYPRKNYFDDEVDTIRERKKAEGSSSHVSEFLDMKVDYHTKHPMIGFVGKKTYSVEELKKVLLAMEEFAGEKGMTNYESENENDGCHLCLYLGSGTNIQILYITYADKFIQTQTLTFNTPKTYCKPYSIKML